MAATQILGIFFDGPGMIVKTSVVPVAAKEEDILLTRAMGITQTLQGIANFLAPLTTGLLIAAVGEANTLLAATLLFLLCIVLVSRLRNSSGHLWGLFLLPLLR